VADSPSILVADDNVQSLGLVASILRSAGYEVVAVEGGGPAVDAARSNPFDLILLDGMMPDLDGFEACEQIRQLPSHTDTPIVFLTGMTDEGTLQDATEVGADEVLAKPIRRSGLLLRVGSLLRLGRLRAERDKSRDQRAELIDLVLGDLEGPINVLRARLGTLQASEELPSSLGRALEDLAAAELRLDRARRTLLDVQRGAEGKLRLRPRPVHIDRLLGSLHTRWVPIGARYGIDVELGTLELERPLSLDEGLLRRSLENLLDHAALTARSRVSIEARGSGDGVSITVRDDGEPLSTREVRRMQTSPDSTVTGRLPRSRGLGPVLCRLVAEAHGGSLGMSSSDDGTEVVIRLREAPAPA